MDSEISTGYRELRTFLGTDWEHFIEQQRLGYVRVGQAFMNVLPDEQSSLLVGSPYDPFYSRDWHDVYRAVDYLTSLGVAR